MKNWFSASHGSALPACNACMAMQHTYIAFFAFRDIQIEVTIFHEYEARSRTYAAFFSRYAMHLAIYFGASPCDARDPEGLELLAGDDRCWGEPFRVSVTQEVVCDFVARYRRNRQKNRMMW